MSDLHEATFEPTVRREAEEKRQVLFGKYEVLRKLGQGGIGEVFVARRVGDDRVCVLKRSLPGAADVALVQARSRREAESASMLDHPNIARLYDAAVGDDGSFYLAMELIDGKDLDVLMQALRGTALSAELAVYIGAKMLDGLHYAHEIRDAGGAPVGLVHRDVSMRNVMVTYDGEVKVIDFGLVKSSVGEFRTTPGMVLGTPRTMSPEQAMGEAVDRRSDVYSASAVLFELVTGRPLITATGGALEVLRAVLLVPSPGPETIAPALPLLSSVIARGLDKDASERWPTAAAMRNALVFALPITGGAQRELGELLGKLFPDRALQDLAIFQPEAPDVSMTRVEDRAPWASAPTRRSYAAPALVILAVLFAAFVAALSRPKASAPPVTPPPQVRAPPVTPEARPLPIEARAAPPPPRVRAPPPATKPARDREPVPSPPVASRLEELRRLIHRAAPEDVAEIEDRIQRLPGGSLTPEQDRCLMKSVASLSNEEKLARIRECVER